LCIFHQTTGLLCPGCGSLRALHQLLHGNWVAAFHYNALLVGCLPLALLLTAACAVRRFRGRPVLNSPHSLWPWVLAFLIVGLAFGVWRNIPGSALAMVQP
ncbi:MAG TPA: DUF2752 domain-containing protein, partial [Verrucomicrobiae bacterium]|nr:DUF2752 domain-containing protein [Verrucomicrobiae bacterium]